MGPILNIFPEGCTTNGTKLIQFKKGAFNSLRAVRPVVITYNSPEWGLSPTQDVLGFVNSQFLMQACGYITVNVDVLPVFLPNDYFWKNHWHEGKEEKWQAFARVIRDIMAKQGGFGLSDCTMEDKFKFQSILKEQKAIKKQRVKNE